MVRQSRQKRHLKRLNAMKQAAIRLAFPADEEEGFSSGDDVLWSDDELDQQAEATYRKLFPGVSNLPSKRPSHYSGNSKQTKQRRHAEGKRQAVKNGQTILNFFSPISVSTSNVTLGEDCLLDNEHDTIFIWSRWIWCPVVTWLYMFICKSKIWCSSFMICCD